MTEEEEDDIHIRAVELAQLLTRRPQLGITAMAALIAEVRTLNRTVAKLITLVDPAQRDAARRIVADLNVPKR